MIPRDVKSPSRPIPFHKLLKIVAIIDRNDDQTKELLDHIEAENFQIEVSDNYERDVSEDADVGAYVALVDGGRLERARKLARSVREIGFQTPLWALADSHRIADLTTLAAVGEVDGYIYLGQQTPAFYAKQVAKRLTEAGVDREVRGLEGASDHAPAWIVLRDASPERRKPVRRSEKRTDSGGSAAEAGQ